MDEIATKDTQWTTVELQTELDEFYSQYEEVYKSFMEWSIKYGKLEHTPKKDKELDSIINGNWNLTDDERIDEFKIREEVQTQILIDQFRTENQELETKSKKCI